MLSRKEFMKTVWSAVTKLYGEYGASSTGLVLIDYNVEKKMAIIRTSLDTLAMVRASMALITGIADREISVHVLAVSGTIKALCKKTKQE
jgi:RNase P/RNase MRP subunit POP5